MAGVRQIRANVENAQKSTGPTSTEGKPASRRNALKHGLAVELVLPEDNAEESRERAAQPVSSLEPDNAWEVWLTERIGVLLVRIERRESQDAILRRRSRAAGPRAGPGVPRRCPAPGLYNEAR